jgi:hypothetical protein
MIISTLRRALVTGAVMTALVLPAIAAQAQGTVPPKAKITPKQAEVAAVRKLGGKASPAKYEFEDGHWQYAVIVTTSKGMYEAEVSSTTGKVTATEKTTPAEEAKEAAADKKAAAAHGAKKGSKMKAEKPEKGEAGEKGEKD